MEHTKYLLVIDTMGDGIAEKSFGGPRILDVQILISSDPESARQKYLNTIPLAHARSLYNAIYVFELGALESSMDKVKEKGGDPAFRFVLPNNTRPPKMPNLAEQVSTSLGNRTITQPNDSQTMDRRTPDAPPQVAPPNREELVENATKSPRSEQFHEVDYKARTTPEVYTEDQKKIIRSIGADQSMSNANEAVNLRVNAATGENHSLASQPQQPYVSDNISTDKAQLLQNLGVDSDNMNVVPDNDIPASYPETPDHYDPSLAEVPNDGVLDESDIQRLEAEYEELQSENSNEGKADNNE